MINHYFFLVLSTFISITATQAQCSGCTTTIANANSTNQVVSSGQTLCITPTGTVSGLITILAGGKVCNQGLISSANVWVAGGALANTGTITVNNLYVASAGTFTNDAKLDADSFLVAENNTTYYNNGTQINLAFAVAEHASAVNGGTVTTNILYDSIGNLINNGNVIITDGFANGWNSYCENNGNINITHDFANGYNSTFINNKNMKILRSFYNGNNSVFTTYCMVTVNQDWYNTATVLGPVSSCGGFNIGATSSNAGIVGSSNTHLDICDAGHPTSGFDANSGNVASTTTYCSCANNCITVGVQEIAASAFSSLSLYPNPASTQVNIKYYSEITATVNLTIKDMMGKTVFSKKQETTNGLNELQLAVGDLAEGTYILSIADNVHGAVNRMFTVVK